MVRSWSASVKYSLIDFYTMRCRIYSCNVRFLLLIKINDTNIYDYSTLCNSSLTKIGHFLELTMKLPFLSYKKNTLVQLMKEIQENFCFLESILV